MLNVNSEEQVTQIEDIEPPIQYQTSDSMKKGQQKVLREGTEGKQQVTYRLTKRNGSLLEEEQVDRKTIKAPIATIILKGTKVIRGEGSGHSSGRLSALASLVTWVKDGVECIRASTSSGGAASWPRMRASSNSPGTSQAD